MIEKITVGLGDRAYPVWIGAGILDCLGDALREIGFPRKIAVVTNPVIQEMYGERVLLSLRAGGFVAQMILVPEGEEFKNAATLNSIYDALIEGSFDRSSGLLAFGGGVVGDVAGYAAATYLRGIPFVQVPTTLLSQVDSSVGGKTGINHPLGKNLIGAFYQPRHVHIDVSTLETLPKREFAAGMAEVIKYGIIRDANFFAWLGEHRDRLRRLDREALVQAVKRSCQIKADIVERDEKESSLRAILNYGHTFGHAVETLAGYGEIRHGEAVAMGMSVAAMISRELGLCTAEQVAAIGRLLGAFALPVAPPPFPLDAYLQSMGRDKKVKAGILRLVLNQGIGNCLIREVPDPESLFAKVLQTASPH